MKIRAVRSWRERIALTRPYAIAGASWDSVELVLVELSTDGVQRGFGQASPASEVTGESVDACAAELTQQRLEWLADRELDDFDGLVRETRERVRGPAARAAVDMALHDLLAKKLGQPLADVLGRAHREFETSITLGIQSLARTLADADEYVARGFRLLKVKVGEDVESDLERLAKLRERFGRAVGLRADANQGYDSAALRRFLEGARELDLELLEQPMAREDDSRLSAAVAGGDLPFAADESIHDEHDARTLVAARTPYSIFNLKLMKSGGIAEARRIADVAQRAGVGLMWGCMDESVLGIAAALHTAYSCAATRYLDLDGSLDLARDPFRGGFELANGRLRTLDRPGLGVEPS